MFGRKVKCRDCGYLARHLANPLGPEAKIPKERLENRLMLQQLGVLSPHECNQQQRADIDEARISESFAVFCLRHVWSEFDYLDHMDRGDFQLGKTVDEDRKCRLFCTYQPGYSPLEHRELQRERETRRVVLVGALSAAAIGAAASIITRWIFG